MGECGLLNSVCKHYFDEVDIIGLSYSIAIISCNHNFSNSMLRGVKSRPNILHFHRLAQSLIFLLAASVMKSFAFVRTLTRTQCWSTPLVPFNSIQSGITPWRRLNVALLATNKRSLRAEGVPQPAKESKAREKSQNSPQQAAASTSPGSSIYTKSSLEVNTSDRPYTLPPGEFKPKQSLGQNYLSDQNYVLKIVNAFSTDEVESNRVVEIGPGLGALTRVLVR